jgi:alanyl-tRNA synthetase
MQDSIVIDMFLHRSEAEFPRVPAESLLSNFFPTSFVSSAGPAILLEHLDDESHAPDPPRCKVLQPCVRYWDLPNVGDNTHLSFFEMVACASFESDGRAKTLTAITSFLSQDCGIVPGRLWATYFHGGTVNNHGNFPIDRDALDFWKNFGISETQIVAVDGSEGFVANQSEPVGGYRTELYVETSSQSGAACDHCRPPFCRCGRFLELATSVAYEFRVSFLGEAMTIVPLDRLKMYAAGFGVERLESIMHGTGLIHGSGRIADMISFTQNEMSLNLERARRVVLCDAVRALVFLLADGGGKLNGQANKSRRWVINKWLNTIRSFSLDEVDLRKLVAHTLDLHSGTYPHLRSQIAIAAYEALTRAVAKC